MNRRIKHNARMTELSPRHARIRLLFSILAAPIVLSGCAGAATGGRSNPSKRGERSGRDRAAPDGTDARRGADPNAQFKHAQELWQKGRCKAAIPIFRAVVLNGAGYENAQYMLGDCLVQVGQAGNEISADYMEGIAWLRRAADVGWPEAQGRLMIIYFSGSESIRNLEQAAFWREVYLRNTKRKRVAFVPISMKLLDEVEATLTNAQLANARAKAAAWSQGSPIK